MLSIYKDPEIRFAGLVCNLSNPGVTAAMKGAVLSLDIGDTVSVSWTPSGVGSPITQTCLVEGVRHTAHFGQCHFVEVALSPNLFALSSGFILDSATDGLLDTSVLSF